VRSASFDHQGEERINITVSIGVACFPAHGESYQGLVGAADAAMYRAKQEGRDCVRVAEKPSGNLKLAK
jgi:diguanylate cyclase (GGDEF)-like protein